MFSFKNFQHTQIKVVAPRPFTIENFKNWDTGRMITGWGQDESYPTNPTAKEDADKPDTPAEAQENVGNGTVSTLGAASCSVVLAAVFNLFFY